MTALDRLSAPKQRAFVHEYLVRGEGKAAAIAAGYSPRHADKQAYLLLENPRVAAAVAEARDAAEERNAITLDRTVQELAHIAYADLTDVVTWDQNGKIHIRSSDDLSERARAAIKKLKVTRSRPRNGSNAQWEVETVEFELHGKIEALDKLMRFHGAYKRDNERKPEPNYFLDARTQVLAPVLGRLTEEQQLQIAMRMLEGEE